MRGLRLHRLTLQREREQIEDVLPDQRHLTAATEPPLRERHGVRERLLEPRVFTP